MPNRAGMVLGAVIAGLGAVLLFRRAKAEPVPPEYVPPEFVPEAEVGFTVRVKNYSHLLARVEASWKWVPSEFPGEPPVYMKTIEEARWYARIASPTYYQGYPLRYLDPADGSDWRPLTEGCPFVLPGDSEWWNPYPYVEIWLAAGPCCYGRGWSDPQCSSFGTIIVKKVAVPADGQVVFDLSPW